MDKYDTSLVWLGTWEAPSGFVFNGFHVWDTSGEWVGVYQSQTRAIVEANI